MSDPAALIGLCRPGIAAQMLTILNTVRLARRLGVPAGLVAEGWGRDETDPHFEDGFIVPAGAAAVGDRRLDLATVMPVPHADAVAGQLRSGRQVVIDNPAGILVLADEDTDAVASEISAVAAELPYRADVRAAYDALLGHLDLAVGGVGRAAALCLDPGAGPVLPDEVLSHWAAAQECPALLFGGEQGRAAHLQRGNPELFAVDAMIESAGAPPALRPLLQILLMARCALIGAGVGSRPALAAAAIGQRRFCPLPDDLPPAHLRQAMALLLDRVSGRPDSFADPADLIAGAEQAATFAIGAGQAHPFLADLSDQPGLMTARPRLRHVMAVLALSLGFHLRAGTEARRGLVGTVLDAPACARCQQVLDVLEGSADPGSCLAQDAFLMPLFANPSQRGPAQDQIARAQLLRAGGLAEALIYLPLPGLPAEGEGDLPLWTCRIDWAELLADDDARRTLIDEVALPERLALAGPDLPAIETALAAGGDPEIAPSAALFRQAGLAASALSLHGRYARALRLLEWLERADPGAALTQKRLSDTMFRLQRIEDGFDHLQRAIDAMPDNPLLHLALARHAAACGQAARALDALDTAETLSPGRALTAWQSGRVRADLAAD